MEENTGKKTLKPYQGILFFVIIMFTLLFVCAPIQYYLGMGGLAITELLFLAMSVGYVLLLKGDLREVFPLKPLKVAPFFGTLLMWAMGYLAITAISLLLSCFFPEQFYSVSEGLSNVLYSVPAPLTILIAAVLPAICEESVHRGVILSSLKSINNKWMIVLIMTILFGVFHADPIRFVPTALLGGIMSYLVLTTDNMWYGVIFHFVNNLISTIGGSQADPELLQASQDLLMNTPGYSYMVFGMYLIMCCVVPFGIYTAAYLVRLVKKDTERVTYFPQNHKGITIAALIITTVLCVVVGMAVMVLAIVSNPDMIRQMMEFQY